VKYDERPAFEKEYVELDPVGTRARGVYERSRRILEGGVGRSPVPNDLDPFRFPCHSGDVLIFSFFDGGW
jgi:hypothetical protein